MNNLWRNEGFQHPFYRAFKNGMLHDMGLWNRRHEPNIDEEIKEACQHTFDTKSRRVSLNRWMEVIHSCKHFLAQWHRTAVIWTFIVLREGLKPTSLKTFDELAKSSGSEAAVAPVKGTNTGRAVCTGMQGPSARLVWSLGQCLC